MTAVIRSDEIIVALSHHLPHRAALDPDAAERKRRGLHPARIDNGRTVAKS